MTTIDDDAGRAWRRFNFTEAPTGEESCLLTLVTTDEDGNLLILGNAFVVSPQGAAAICLTAAHCFEEAFKHQIARTARPHPTLPVDFRPQGTKYIKTDDMAAIYLTPDGPLPCRVRDVNYIDNYDGATFTAHAPEAQSLFSQNLAIDLGIPSIGEEVAVLAHRIEVQNLGNGEAAVSRTVDLCSGVVTAITMDAARMGLMFSFETTIPFRPGMSGAPIVKCPKPGDKVSACGIVSFDFSSDQAFSDFSHPGLSTGSMIWPAMGLGFNVLHPGEQSPALSFLADLVALGAICDRSGGVSVTARHDADGIEVTYLDTREITPIHCVLRTPRHPLAPR